jgi:hypothetical protein
MVGSWQCKVSSKIHINGHRISEPVREDKGKMMAPELADRSVTPHVSKPHDYVNHMFMRP